MISAVVHNVAISFVDIMLKLTLLSRIIWTNYAIIVVIAYKEHKKPS